MATREHGVGVGAVEGPHHEGAVGQPLRLLRLAAMAEDLLAEVRQLDLDPAGSRRLQRIFTVVLRELRDVLTGDLRDEMETFLIAPSPEHPDELRLAQAQLTGWLEGVVRCVAAHRQAEALETFIRGAVEQARARAGEHQQREQPPGQYL